MADSMDQPPRRKRGRPRKDATLSAPLPKSKMPPRVQASTSIVASTPQRFKLEKRLIKPFDDIEDSELARSASRRSMRSRAIDPTKEMIIFSENDDPIELFNLSESEIGEFLVAMSEKYDFSEEAIPAVEESGDAPRVKSVRCSTPSTPKSSLSAANISATESMVPTVFTPRVSVLKEFSKPGVKSSSSKYRASRNPVETLAVRKLQTRNHRQISFHEGEAIFHYGDYDFDEEDEAAIVDMNSKAKQMLASPIDNIVTVDVLESCIIALERQLEVAVCLDSPKTLASAHLATSRQAIDEGQRTIGALSKLLQCDLFSASVAETEEALNSVVCSTCLNEAASAASSQREFADDTADNIAEPPKRRGRKRKTEIEAMNSLPSSQSLSSLSVTSEDSKIFSLRAPSPVSSEVKVSHVYDKITLLRLVPFEQVTFLLCSMLLSSSLRDISANSSSSSSSSNGSSSIVDIDEGTAETIARDIYEHWISKRSSRQVSLLRCFHDFIMENWQRSEQALAEAAYVDFDKPNNLINSHKTLMQLRKDLDRARLIVDRVRRREKMKRDLIRMSIESLASLSAEIDVGLIADEFVPFLDRSETGDVEADVMAELYRRPPVEPALPLPPVENESYELCSDVDLSVTESVGTSLWHEIDRRLALGVACCGLQYMERIRSEFGLTAHLSDIFLRKRLNQIAQQIFENGVFETPEFESLDKNISYLSFDIPKRSFELLDCFDENEVWQRVIIRLLSDNTYRTDSANSYPIIRIPERYQNQKHLKFKYMLLTPPTVMHDRDFKRFQALCQKSSASTHQVRGYDSDCSSIVQEAAPRKERAISASVATNQSPDETAIDQNSSKLLTVDNSRAVGLRLEQMISGNKPSSSLLASPISTSNKLESEVARNRAGRFSPGTSKLKSNDLLDGFKRKIFGRGNSDTPILGRKFSSA